MMVWLVISESNMEIGRVKVKEDELTIYGDDPALPQEVRVELELKWEQFPFKDVSPRNYHYECLQMIFKKPLVQMSGGGICFLIFKDPLTLALGLLNLHASPLQFEQQHDGSKISPINHGSIGYLQDRCNFSTMITPAFVFALTDENTFAAKKKPLDSSETREISPFPPPKRRKIEPNQNKPPVPVVYIDDSQPTGHKLDQPKGDNFIIDLDSELIELIEPKKSSSHKNQQDKEVQKESKAPEKKEEIQIQVEEVKEPEKIEEKGKEERVKNMEPWLDDFKDDIECSICREYLILAHTLPCSHTFCKNCIEEWLQRQKKRSEKTCPECRKPVRQKPTPVGLLDNLVEKFVVRLLPEKEYQERQEKIAKLRQQAKSTGSKDNPLVIEEENDDPPLQNHINVNFNLNFLGGDDDDDDDDDNDDDDDYIDANPFLDDGEGFDDDDENDDHDDGSDIEIDDDDNDVEIDDHYNYMLANQHFGHNHEANHDDDVYQENMGIHTTESCTIS